MRKLLFFIELVLISMGIMFIFIVVETDRAITNLINIIKRLWKRRNISTQRERRL